MSRRLLLICLVLVAAITSTTLAAHQPGADPVDAAVVPASGLDTVEDRSTATVEPTARVERRHDHATDLVERDEADLTSVVPDVVVIDPTGPVIDVVGAVVGASGSGSQIGGRAPPALPPSSS